MDNDRNHFFLPKHGVTAGDRVKLATTRKERQRVSSLTKAGPLVVASGYTLTSTNAASVNSSNHGLGALKWKRRAGVKAGRGRVGRKAATQP